MRRPQDRAHRGDRVRPAYVLPFLPAYYTVGGCGNFQYFCGAYRTMVPCAAAFRGRGSTHDAPLRRSVPERWERWRAVFLDRPVRTGCRPTAKDAERGRRKPGGGDAKVSLMEKFNRSGYYRRVLTLAFPVILSQAGQILVQLVDNAMVGRLGAVPLAGVSFANAVFFMLFVLGTGMSLGLTPLYNPPFQNYNDFSGYFKVFP